MEHMLMVWILFAVMVIGYGLYFILDRITGSKDAFPIVLAVVIAVTLVILARWSSKAEKNPQSMEGVRELCTKETEEYIKKAEQLSDKELLDLFSEVERSFEQDQTPIVAVRKARLDAVNAVLKSRGLDNA